jgi:hypothetical protein
MNIAILFVAKKKQKYRQFAIVMLQMLIPVILWASSDILGLTVPSVLLTQYCSGDKIERNEMGRECRVYGGEERRIQGFGGETSVKETTWETQA